MKTCCVVVIGHVDHGKTALVQALTGVDTDRLPEEKARGLSITPGFAHRNYRGGIVDFVDAPGHADFISAMVSGASGAQAALVVIAITGGICAQTREHLRIAELLGVRQAVIAVTKADLLPRSERAKRLEDIRDGLSQTPFASAPVVVCSALSGDGLDRLNEALEALVDNACPPCPPPGCFLPIDRVFSVSGRGTVVTGTLLGAAMGVGDSLMLHPLDRAVTLRALQSRGTDRDRIHPHERMAANLRGIAQGDIPRGAVLCAAGTAQASRCIDVTFELPEALGQSLKHMQEIRVLFGTSNEVAQVRLFKDEGARGGFAQLRFRKPVVCFAGQRAILRSLSPPLTLGGAVILDPQAHPARPNDHGRVRVLKAAHARDIPRLADALAHSGRGVADLTGIARLARMSVDNVRAELGGDFGTLQGTLVTSVQTIEAAKSALTDVLSSYHARHPLRTAMPRASVRLSAFSPPLLQHAEDALFADHRIRRQDTALALWDHNPLALLDAAQHRAMAQIEAQFRASGLTPLTAEQCLGTDDAADLRQLLIEGGTLIALRNVSLGQTLLLHQHTVATAAQTLSRAFPAARPFTTSQARNALGTSRRVIVPLLEYLDSAGVTLRQGDTRQVVAANLVPPPASQS